MHATLRRSLTTVAGDGLASPFPLEARYLAGGAVQGPWAGFAEGIRTTSPLLSVCFTYSERASKLSGRHCHPRPGPARHRRAFHLRLLITLYGFSCGRQEANYRQSVCVGTNWFASLLFYCCSLHACLKRDRAFPPQVSQRDMT